MIIVENQALEHSILDYAKTAQVSLKETKQTK